MRPEGEGQGHQAGGKGGEGSKVGRGCVLIFCKCFTFQFVVESEVPGAMDTV